MRVLIADKFEQVGIDRLREAGLEVDYQPELADDSLAAALRAGEADVLIVRSTRVTEPMLDAGRLSLVVRAGAGYNTIDVGAASRRGIYVSNCPGKNAVAVAELTFGLILALDRRIPDGVADLRGGRWNKKEYSRARGLFGRTLGVLGAGSIAREVIRRALAFGMPVVLWSRRYAGEDRALGPADAAVLGIDAASLGPGIRLAPAPEEVAARCDILTLHLALGPGTRGIAGASVLGRLAPGSYVVNTSRGELVDEAALLDVMRTRGIRAGLDVYQSEPAAGTGEFRHDLAQSPSVYGTHHIGASTEQAQEAIALETVRIVRAYAETGTVPNVVNLSRQTPASHMLTVRHRDRPGVLAHVFDHLRAADLNVQETENIVFEGAEAAVARINLDGAPADDLLSRIRSGNPHILDLHLVKLGHA